MRSPSLPAWFPAVAGMTLAIAALSGRARAQTAPSSSSPPASTAPAAPPEEDDEAGPGTGTRRKPAPDTRTGNLLIDARIGYSAPAGLASVNTEQNNHIAVSDLTGSGLSVGGILGVGISRHVSLEATGTYSMLTASTGCVGCRGRVIDVGLGLAYHLAQGIAVDPWLSFGMGYRHQTYSISPTGAILGTATTIATPALVDLTYHGFDFARLAIGTDFYPVPFFGLGPFFEVDMGSNLGLPIAGSSPSVYAFFQIGARVAFDPFRRAAASTPARSAGR